ncbi:MAG TPA: hypothetical protein VGS02_02830 [Acidobacteriaceae bacterium]|nr:hypothetical protein [Acidobacteriaceae bacterium]
MNTSQATTQHGNKSSSNGDVRAGFRTKTIATRLTPEELVEIEFAAEEAGKPLAEWLRETALNAARKRSPNAIELLLAEVWAVRYALLNLFRAGAQANVEGKAMAPEFVTQIREEADAQKLEHARQLIEDFVRYGEKRREI